MQIAPMGQCGCLIFLQSPSFLLHTPFVATVPQTLTCPSPKGRGTGKCQLIAQRVKVRQRRLYTISVSTQPALAAIYSLIAARSASITWQREGSRSIPCSEGG